MVNRTEVGLVALAVVLLVLGTMCGGRVRLAYCPGGPVCGTEAQPWCCPGSECGSAPLECLPADAGAADDAPALETLDADPVEPPPQPHGSSGGPPPNPKQQ